MKKIRYFFEAVFLYFMFFIFRLLPPDTASGVGGTLARTIGPLLAASRKAKRNLQRAMPDLSPEEQDKVIADMWENLGRVMAEYPHLERISIERMSIEGEDVLSRLFESRLAAVFFGGHLGNWEVNTVGMLTRYGKETDLTYRAPNNPWSDRLLTKARTLNGRLQAYPKSRSSGKDIIEALKGGRYLGILIDQKYNEGIPVPFFGVDAMTNPIFVQLCQKYKCPLIPVQNIRTGGANFKIVVHEPLSLFDGNTPRPVEDVIKDAHTLLEGWIRQSPGQWLWLHRRWNSKQLKTG